MSKSPVPAVELSKMSFSWPGMKAALFDEVSLAFPPGETTCLLGPNGSGKTTLLELILGWRKSNSGNILVHNQSVGMMPSRERGRTMALVPQEERLPFAYSVLDYVLLGRAPHLPPLATPGNSDREIALNALERVGILSLANRAVPRLSGGEKRLVLIARALAQEPRILLLDEPANHLDPANRERIRTLLAELHDSGITMILSSHEPEMVGRLAHHIVLLRRAASPLMGLPGEMLVPEKLSSLYGVPVRTAEAEGRRIILWGD